MVTVFFTMVIHNGNFTLHNGNHTMGPVHFTMVTTQRDLYTSQWLPYNGKATLHNAYKQWEVYTS